MSTLTQDAPAVKASCCRLVLEIGDTAYRVRPIDPGYQDRAFALRKADGTTYHVAAGPDGHSCDCPDCTFRDRPCKHLKALCAVGLLPPLPAAPEADPEPEPAPEPEPEPARVDALDWAYAIESLWDVATEEQRALAVQVHQSDSALGRKVVPPGPSVAELRARHAAATRPKARTIRVESNGADATMQALGWEPVGQGWQKTVPSGRPTGLNDYDSRRWSR